MSKPEGWFYLVGALGETLAHQCSKCGSSHIIFDGPARIFHCGKWEEYTPPAKSSGPLSFFSADPEPLPRVRFRETPLIRLDRNTESLEA